MKAATFGDSLSDSPQEIRIATTLGAPLRPAKKLLCSLRRDFFDYVFGSPGTSLSNGPASQVLCFDRNQSSPRVVFILKLFPPAGCRFPASLSVQVASISETLISCQAKLFAR